MTLTSRPEPRLPAHWHAYLARVRSKPTPPTRQPGQLAPGAFRRTSSGTFVPLGPTYRPSVLINSPRQP